MPTTTKSSKSTKSASSKTCASCAHYQASASLTGECRRHAPQTITFQVDDEVKFQSCFPAVKASDWCGEFKAKA